MGFGETGDTASYPTGQQEPKPLDRIGRAGIARPAACHTFRYSLAIVPLKDRYDIRTVQELLGHQDVRTTMIYTHVLNRGGKGVRSPADTL